LENLRPYASFLLQNYLDEFVWENIRLCRELNLSLPGHNQEEQFLLTKQAQDFFLKTISEGLSTNCTTNEKKTLTYLIASASLRKQAFTHFLPFYTTDVKVALAVMKSIEDFTQAELAKAIKENELNYHLMEDASLKQTEELDKIKADLDNFIYTASHDLKAPIANIEGLINTLFSEIEISTNQLHLRDMINASIDKFRNTIKYLAEISKVQKEDDQDITLINLTSLFSEITEEVKDLIEGTNATITTNFEVQELYFSYKNLYSILYNLVSNAIKYSSPVRIPLITITTKSKEDFLLLIVADNGLGIKASQKDKIFTMFKRLHDHVEGSGIGLYIVKRIVENSGGWLEVESEEGKGSEFHLWLKLQSKFSVTN